MTERKMREHISPARCGAGNALSRGTGVCFPLLVERKIADGLLHRVAGEVAGETAKQAWKSEGVSRVCAT